MNAGSAAVEPTLKVRLGVTPQQGLKSEPGLWRLGQVSPSQAPAHVWKHAVGPAWAWR
ncbi:hypothetical protein ARTHRO8AJ_380001 [Arthrobacter sp. 8AJ]|nr:hypothetical protein ARTHRO8AJ_380001 [Arthrobacter sp. 8AJ]